jgi:ADP-ribose pyrophosphatase YjhB (NUDIX family)
MISTKFPFCVVGCLIKRKKQILLQKRERDLFKEYLTLPVGKLRLNESIVDAFSREMKEETGLTPLNARFKGIIEILFTMKRKRFHTIIVLVETTEFKGKIKESDVRKYRISPDIKILFKDFVSPCFLYVVVYMKLSKREMMIKNLRIKRIYAKPYQNILMNEYL